MMMTTAQKIPRLRMGRFTEMAQTEVTNVGVRVEDRAAFLAVIHRREDLIANARKAPRGRSARAAEVASFALAARENLVDGQRATAIENLETAAALAIAAIAELKGQGR